MSRRERYEAANIRGGLGVRKRLSDESFRTTYRLNGVQRGATIAECLDKYGRWEGGYRLGVLVRKTANWVYVKWDDEEEIAAVDHGDARYAVDRGKWRITNPRIGSPLDQQRGESARALAQKLSEQEGQRALTGHNADEKINSSPQKGGTPPTEEMIDMAKEMSNAAAERAAAKKALDTGSLAERETYTAKQVATRCGTDAKTMRKFFRSSHSTVDPVGQGGRYEFLATDLPKIKDEFDSWSSRGKAKSTPKQKVAKKAAEKVVEESDDEDISMDQVADAIERSQEEELTELVKDHFGDDHEPTDEELEEMAKLIDVSDLDLDELDAEEV